MRCSRAMRSTAPVEVGCRRADVALYHVGNNQLHRAIYRRALADPGVVVLHDAVLQHFFLGSLDREAYVEEFIYNYGEWIARLAGDLWNNRARSAADPRYFEYPMLKRIANGFSRGDRAQSRRGRAWSARTRQTRA